MKITMYKNPGLFFCLSTVFPWTLWFIAAYVSHAEPGSVFLTNLSSIVAFLGLITPIGVTLFLAKGNKELIDDVLGRFLNFKGIKVKYLLLTCFLML